jgi:hypothetical protein
VEDDRQQYTDADYGPEESDDDTIGIPDAAVDVFEGGEYYPPLSPWPLLVAVAAVAGSVWLGGNEGLTIVAGMVTLTYMLNR